MISQPKEWKQSLRDELEKSSTKKDDLLKIIRLCDAYIQEIRSLTDWINIQASFVGQVKRQYGELYFLMFNENPPENIQQEKPIILLEVSQKEESEKYKRVITDKKERKKVVIEVALEISQPNTEITAQTIYNELIKRGINLNAKRPNAVITTILSGYRSVFEKIQGRKGVFKRIG